MTGEPSNTIETNNGKGQFFSVSIQTLDLIAAQDGGADGVLSYLVLARHAKAKGPDDGRLTSAGAFAIQKKAGLTRHSAEEALNCLRESEGPNGVPFIVVADDIRARLGVEVVPEHFGHGKNNSIRTKVQWWLAPSKELIYLANALIDGIGAGKDTPPLARIYSQSEPDINAGITMGQARLDTVMLLVHLYRHHRLEECGGVDPRAGLYREWKLAETPTELEFGSRDPITPLDGSNAALYEVECSSTTTMWTRFAATALAYISDEVERHQRFWCAFNNLKRLGLVYEVLTVWNGDPLRSKTAELQYPLYIFDRHARDSEPYLQREIHKMAMDLGEIDYADLVLDRGASLISSGRFRFIAIKKKGAYPLGVFRLRFRPKTKDTGAWIEAERQRCLRWTNSCRQLVGKSALAEWAQPQALNPTHV